MSWASYIFWGWMCAHRPACRICAIRPACQTACRLRSIVQMGFLPIGVGSTLVDQVGSSRTFGRLCCKNVHNVNTEALGSENQLVSIVD